MINLIDASVLAVTKLRSHKIRTTITIIVSSILFAALIAAFVIATGITKSMTEFNSKGLNNKYFVAASPVSPLPGGYAFSQDFLSYLQVHYQEYITEKTAAAKKLGVTYDPKTEQSPITIVSVPSQGTQARPNFGNPEVFNLMQQYANKHPAPDISDLKRVASPYHPISFEGNITANLGNYLMLMPNGKEIFGPTDTQSTELQFFGGGEEPEIMGQSVTEPFLLPGVNVNHDDVPIIVSYQIAEKMLGIKSLPLNATNQQKIDRIQQLYSAAKNNITLTLCYRNNVSAGQIQTAVQQYTDAANTKDYQKPDLTYGFPDPSSCGKAPVTSDTRTAAQKNQQAAEDQFNDEFNLGTPSGAPVQQKITFQVVGLSPNSNMNESLTFGDLLSSITGSTLGDVTIPQNLLDQMNDGVPKQLALGKINSGLAIPTTPSFYLVEFSNPSDARKFIQAQNCVVSQEGNTCTNGTSGIFQLSSWANNNLAVADLSSKIKITLELATLAVTILAIIILTVMVGRTIADGRKETAVFRALGAKRGDITIVYTIYTLYLALIIAVVSLFVGIGAAYFIQIIYGHSATLIAKLLFDAVDTGLTFNFFGIDYELLVIAVAVIIVAGLLSMLIPLLRNIPRSPIKDMREE